MKKAASPGAGGPVTGGSAASRGVNCTCDPCARARALPPQPVARRRTFPGAVERAGEGRKGRGGEEGEGG
eukprot:CAMPEP_0184377898 /NCGR_PEP_ID=MMETSP0007-20130409/2637_1 /TAXON_ID=97485 /ORGANISM="Prymnesium parvum, Strain Texoma1" /LENGTH=69 /DNA_ID=CAMNT_0026721955 /DNA_START=127 /DNA_END=332 /DNA_ORIENTATION=+